MPYCTSLALREAARTIVLYGTLLLAIPATADLRSTTLSSLVAESDLIVLARVDTSERRPDGSGTAVLAVQQTFKGAAPTEPIHLDWSSEVHEQRIPAPPAAMLLFLRRHDGSRLSGTHYGRSYWKLEADDAAGTSCRRYTRYAYPIDMVSIDTPELQRKLIRIVVGSDASRVKILCLDDMAALMQPTPARGVRNEIQRR